MKKKILITLSLVIAMVIGLGLVLNLGDKGENPEYPPEVVENIPTTEIPDGTIYDEDGLEVEGFIEKNPNIISGSIGTEDDKFIVGAKHEQPVYYSQVDSRWKNHPYTSTGNKSQTIGSSGCGPTSAAMVVTSIKGTIIPPDMGDLYVRYGFRSANDGTYHSAFQWTANYFDIPFTRTYNINTAFELIKDNHYVIVSCGPGLFTSGGHFIVVYDYDDSNSNNKIDGPDTLRIYDPYLYNGKFDTSSRKGKVTVSGNTVYCSITNFKNYANSTNYFGFKHDGSAKPDTPVTPAPVTPTPEEKTTVKYVTANSGLNVRSGPGTNYSIVGGLSKGTQVTVYEEQSNWSKIGTNRWVCSDYLSTTKPNSGNTNNATSVNYKVKVTAKSGLNIRTGPGTNYSIVGAYTYGTVVTISQEQSGWLKTNKGWIKATYTTKTTNSSTTQPGASEYALGRYKVTAKSGLNVRTGPGTNYSIKKAYTNGTVFDTYEIRNNWTKTPSGWVCLDYTKLLYRY